MGKICLDQTRVQCRDLINRAKNISVIIKPDIFPVNFNLTQCLNCITVASEDNKF